MYQPVNFGYFCDAFRACNRQDNFTYGAKRALFEYLEDLEDSTGELIQLDVVALCCDYTESTFDDIRRNYSLGDDMTDEDVAEWISDRTAYVGLVDGSLVFAQF
jgi:hypothetical protein